MKYAFCSLLAIVVLAAAAHPSARVDTPGAVYVITNATTGNAVVAYGRSADGSLSPLGTFAAGGIGTGAGLGSQGAVIVSEDHRLLFAVNAGSHSVSSFRVLPDGLELADTVASGGVMPTSVAFQNGLLYALNAGTPNTVSGFVVDRRGRMQAIAGSTRGLSAPATAPAQVSFSDDGTTLIVTERATNSIDVFTIGGDGLLSGPTVYPSAGPTPFGFAVDRHNTVFVSEAGVGGGASSYRVDAGGLLTPLSSMVSTGQRAACWAVLSKNGHFGYVTNAGTGNISGFAVAQDGSLSLLNADGVTAVTGGNPTDVAMSNDGRYLYARVAALNRIAIFGIESDGSLTALPALTGTPAGLGGLAAY
jgi:6-phosphogluconolactonase (cycloisomerase 2 family)